jgi:hypothetical protein
MCLQQTLLQALLRRQSRCHRLDQQATFFPGSRLSIHLSRDGFFGFIPLSNAGALALFIHSFDRDQTVIVCALGFHFLLDLGWRGLQRGQRAQVVIALGFDLSTGLQRCQFAVSHVQQPLLLESVAHAGNHGQRAFRL